MKFTEHLPLVQDSVNKHMSEEILKSSGVEGVSGYTLSEDVTNRELIKALENLAVNQSFINENFSPEQLKVLEDQRIAKNIEDTKMTNKINALQRLITSRRSEFDEGTYGVGTWSVLNPAGVGGSKPMGQDAEDITGKFKGNLAGLFYNPLSWIAKPLYQAIGGWVDWGRDQYHDKWENRAFNYSTAFGGMGGKEFEDTYIAPLQAQLSDLEEDRSNLMYENKKYDDNYDDYFHRRNQIEQDRKLINSTSYDEALHYMDMENLNALLKQ